MHTHTHEHAHRHTLTHMHTCLQTHVYIYMHICMSIGMHNILTYTIHSCVHTFTHVHTLISTYTEDSELAFQHLPGSGDFECIDQDEVGLLGRIREPVVSAELSCTCLPKSTEEQTWSMKARARSK